MGLARGLLGLVALLACAGHVLAQNDQFCTRGATTTTCTYPSGTDAFFTVPLTVTSLLTLRATAGQGSGAGQGQSPGGGATIGLQDIVVEPGSILYLCALSFLAALRSLTSYVGQNAVGTTGGRGSSSSNITYARTTGGNGGTASSGGALAMLAMQC